MTSTDDIAFEILCHCCGHALGQDRSAELQRLASRADWGRVLAMARRHGLRGIVWMVHGRTAFLPPEQQMPIRVEQARTNMRALLQLVALREILDEARRRDLQLLVVKGPALSQDLHGSPTLRWARDLDLLCRQTELAEVRRLIEDLGYEPRGGARKWHVAYGRPAKGVLVELHTRLIENRHLLPADPEIWWEGTRATPLSDFEVPMLGADRQFIHLLLHGAGHAWTRLKWLFDLAAALQRGLALDAARRVSTQYGLRSLLQHSCLLIESSFGYWPEGIPKNVAQTRRERRQIARALACIAAGNHLSASARVRAFAYRLELRSGWPYKMAALRVAMRARSDAGSSLA